MAIDVATLQSRLASVDAYILAGDYTSAKQYLLSAETILKGLPDGSFGDASTNWRDMMDGLWARLKEMEGIATTDSVGNSIRRSNIEYRNAGAGSCD
jgi:hypothetical protein